MALLVPRHLRPGLATQEKRNLALGETCSLAIRAKVVVELVSYHDGNDESRSRLLTITVRRKYLLQKAGGIAGSGKCKDVIKDEEMCLKAQLRGMQQKTIHITYHFII
jgi:hypothetical protein